MIDSSAGNLITEFESARSWSVEYKGVAYDDARRVGSVWYFRDIISHRYSRFALQEQVVLLYPNDAGTTVTNQA